ncbi:SGNH/GDSL hydrolase family protein [Coraliomargarita algicola]|uniref:SGNH/GDSL hydrolase family protein n=1 Tax=Coraliomargarita algicola TaxID=3092156 RepID=A0ABZ0RLQ3_9BACT|nr:SGNH/GDSL hydrolase family protein [Coraliomargarita sp. J2-16]WPJ97140.1 SGNH/GDSL hydrolase family protein [Coraliomargarita sp. J2-16]
MPKIPHLKSLVVALTLLQSMHAAIRLPEITVPADHPKIHSSGYVSQKILTRTLEGQPVQSLQFNRRIRLDGKGYGWDNPGTRIAFRTDASEITAYLYYSENHSSTTARNSVGIYSVNGHSESEWTFKTAATSKVRSPEIVAIELPYPHTVGFHDYELTLPYGDAAEFIGLNLNSGAALETFTSKRALRYVAYGDSVTQGFTSSRVDRSYAYRLAEQKNWELINAGYGGRSSAPEDAKLIASLSPDLATVLIGVND